MPSELEELQEVMEKSRRDRDAVEVRRNIEKELATPSPPGRVSQVQDTEFQQWVVGSNDRYYPAGRAIDKLSPGVYLAGASQDRGLYFERVKVITDQLIRLDDTVSERVIEGMKVFWKPETRAAFERHSLLYKRGVLLWGPAGSGKTSALGMLSQTLIGNGGIVLLCSNPEFTSMALRAFRRIEPQRKIIVLFEDIEETIGRHGEKELLSLLDGEDQIGNVVHIATTNHPEELGPRIVNRPSRFDEVIKIGMPNEKSRRIYLEHAMKGKSFPDSWVTDTKELSIAHLRELVVATQCLGRPYQETIERLKGMRIKPKSSELSAKLGFSGDGRLGTATADQVAERPNIAQLERILREDTGKSQ